MRPWVPALRGQVNHALGLQSSPLCSLALPVSTSCDNGKTRGPEKYHLIDTCVHPVEHILECKRRAAVQPAFSGDWKLMNGSGARAAGPEVTFFISHFTADCWCYAHFSLQRWLFSIRACVLLGHYKEFILDLAGLFPFEWICGGARSHEGKADIIRHNTVPWNLIE